MAIEGLVMRAGYSLLFLFAASTCSAALAQPSEKKTSEEFLGEWARSLCAGDIEAIMSFYEESQAVIAIQSTGHIRTGHDEIRREYEAALREVVFEEAELANLKIRERGDVAWATGRFKALTRRKKDATPWKLEIYTSFVLQRMDETWRIVLEQSTPIAGVPRVQRRN